MGERELGKGEVGLTSSSLKSMVRSALAATALAGSTAALCRWCTMYCTHRKDEFGSAISKRSKSSLLSGTSCPFASAVCKRMNTRSQSVHQFISSSHKDRHRSDRDKGGWQNGR